MIKNVVFDMGGVLIDLYPERMYAACTALMLEGASFGYSTQDMLGNGGDSPLHAYECGQLTTEQFLDSMLQYCRPGVTRQQAADSTFAIMGDIPARRLDAIRTLRKKGYHTYLLSNIQDMHWTFIRDTYLGDTTQLFDATILSHEVGATKPDAPIYEALLRTGINPSESLYFDDVEVNVEGGLRHGLQAVLAVGDEWLPIVDQLPDLTQQ